MRVRVVAALFGLLAVLAPQVSAQVSIYTAHAVLHPFFNSSIANTAQQPFAGTVDFFQNGDGTGLVNITINVMGLNPGANYSIFVHQYGNLAGYIQDPTVGSVTMNNTLFNVGPHFNPFNQMHGCGVGNPRHAGDIGNVSIPAGSNISTWTTIQLQSELLDLGLNMNYTNASIIGRAVVLREMPDTCSQDDTQLGGYLALGVIGVGPAPLNKAVANSQPIDNTNSAPKAVAIIFDQSNTPPNPPKPVGYVYFWTDMNNNTHMRGAVYGFKALSVHGIHIHGSGDEDNNNTISGHWTGPSNTVHGLPPNSTRHWGDLGNVVADSTGVITFNDIWAPLNLISVWNSTNSILGRAIAIHEAVDDGTTTTYGPRYRFGVIGLADPTFPIPAVPMPVYPTVARAQVIFRPFFNNTNVTWPDAPLVGNITFTQNVNGTGDVNVTVMVAGLRGNHEYGLHIHQYGNEINSFDHTTGLPITTWANLGNATDPIKGGVGGHFNPFNQPHGCFGNPARHAGDIGNVSVRNIGDGDRFTVFTYNLTSELLDLGRDSINNNSIIGRTVTLHDMPNPCDGVTPLGNWIAIGVIGIDTTTISVDETQNLAQQEMLTFNPDNNSPKANAVIRDFRAPGGQIVGDVFFWSGSMGEIRMSGAVAGFAPNSSHGVHIHQFGNENSNLTIGPHWAAPGQDGNVFHQLPPYAGRHYGDIIGSVTADANGVVTFFNYSAGFDLLSLTQSSNSIIGHSIAFHEMADTGSATSYGPRYRFGVIGLVSPDFPIPTNLTAPLPPNPNQGPTASPPPPTATPTPPGSGGNGTNGGNTTTTPTTPAPTNGTTAAPNATTAPPTSNPPSTGATATVSHILLAAVVALGVVAAL